VLAVCCPAYLCSWLGDDKLPLMDVNTEHVFVQSTLQTWIANFTAMYSVDGLRIDGT
jgi:alpha-amylase